MTRHILSALLAAVALAALPGALHGAPATAKQWNVNNANEISSGVDYELYNETVRIGHDRHAPVVDLAWVREAGGYFEFRHTAPAGVHDHRRRPVAADQSVALYNTGDGKLDRHSEPHGST
jgi:hypothetical protein